MNNPYEFTDEEIEELKKKDPNADKHFLEGLEAKEEVHENEQK